MTFIPLNEDQVRLLLATAMAYDHRNAGEADVQAWMEAAYRARWRFGPAREAIHAHYAESTAFLMPGHITARLRQRSTQPPAYVALPPSAPAAAENREKVMAAVRGLVKRFSMREDPNVRRPQPKSADHVAAREAARAELDAVRARHEAEETG